MMRCFLSRRTVVPPTSPRSGVHRPGKAGLVLLATLLLTMSLVGACDRNANEEAHNATTGSLAPSDIFSRREPAHTLQAGKRILVAGDSLSISLGEQLEQAFSGTPGIDFTRDGTRSSGLTRPELVNWPEHLKELVERLSPDMVIIMIGANDAMPLQTPDGNHIYFDSPDWPEAYATKARQLVTLCRKANPRAKVYWVGVPPMGELPLATEVKQINAALHSMCRSTTGCNFIDTTRAFADANGHYSRHAKDAASGETLTIRTADGVHMTDAGAKLLAGAVLRTFAEAQHFKDIAGVNELRAFAHDLHPVADEAPVQQAQTERKVTARKRAYTIKQGDTFRSIAKRFGIKASDLAAVNPGVDSRHLALGQILHLPASR